jgi:hypothetical protein
MQNENIKPTEASAVSIATKAFLLEDANVVGAFTVTCTDADGNLRWEETFKNLVVNVGKADLLNKYFAGTSYTAAWYLGLVDGGTSPTSCDFPPTSTAIYHKNRIYCKYSKDEIAVSDYLPDVNGNWQFDLTIQALTINQGDEQDIKGFHPWTKDEILVFKTNSIYSAKFADNTSSPDVVLANSYVKSLTFDIGCVSTDSIANVSGSVFFLSQRGIYVLDPQLDTNLLANTAPMSVDIQKYINRINQKYAYNAYGKVYNGRYYLAVPLDNSQVNNAIFIYNLTNKMWESVDTFPSQIIPRGLFVAKYDEVNTTSRLFTWTDNKGIYLFEEADNDEYGVLISGLKLDFYLPNVFTEDRYEYDVIDGYALTRSFKNLWKSGCIIE